MSQASNLSRRCKLSDKRVRLPRTQTRGMNELMAFGSGLKAPGGKRQDRVRGALLGGAIGDALGAPVEFMSADLIHSIYGKRGIKHYDVAYGRYGTITDDTQLTLLTAIGLLDARISLASGDISSVLDSVCSRYIDWCRHQQGGATGCNRRRPVAGSLAVSLFAYRAPGFTCVSELAKMAEQPRICRAQNGSKGNGGIMRVAPVAIVFAEGECESRAVFELSSAIAALTHGHPSGYLSAAAFSVILHSVINGGSLRTAVHNALSLIDAIPEGREVAFYLRLGLRLAEDEMSVDRALARIGRGAIAEEALGIALFCALVSEDFDTAIRLAVNHDGDSDTTGSLAGQLYGAVVGCSGIASNWTAPLELGAEIVQFADELARIALDCSATS